MRCFSTNQRRVSLTYICPNEGQERQRESPPLFVARLIYFCEVIEPSELCALIFYYKFVAAAREACLRMSLRWR